MWVEAGYALLLLVLFSNIHIYPTQINFSELKIGYKTEMFFQKHSLEKYHARFFRRLHPT